jgi:hypothetical protein
LRHSFRAAARDDSLAPEPFEIRVTQSLTNPLGGIGPEGDDADDFTEDFDAFTQPDFQGL